MDVRGHVQSQVRGAGDGCWGGGWGYGAERRDQGPQQGAWVLGYSANASRGLKRRVLF